MAASEFDTIEGFKALLSEGLPSAVVGIGDDAAVLPLPSGGNVLVSTDSLVEEVHFSSLHLSAFDLGWKCLAVSISDIAAMGARPYAALVNLHLSEQPTFCLTELYQGLAACAKHWNVAVVGGDTVRAKEFSLVSTVLGCTESGALLRSAVKPGDSLWVSARLGGPALALHSFTDEHFALQDQELLRRFREELRRPMPGVALGQRLLNEGLAHAAIDISDGLLQDVSHLANASGVCITIDAKSVPHYLHEFSQAVSTRLVHSAAFTGGDQYCLAFSVPQAHTSEVRKKASEWGVFEIGHASRLKARNTTASNAEASTHSQLPPGEVRVIDFVGAERSAEEFVASFGACSLGYTHF